MTVPVFLRHMADSMTGAAIFAAVVVLATCASPEPAIAQDGTCNAEGPALGAAYRNYAAACPGIPRVDCDPIGGGAWRCSSARIGAAAPLPSILTPPPVVVAPPPVVVAPPPVALSCEVTRSGLAASRKAFATECAGFVRVDCDPAGGADWQCASYRIGAVVSAPVVTTPPPVTTPTPVPTSGLVVEAETASSSLWRRTADGLLYDGPNRFALSSRRDDANLVYTVNVPVAGTYRFKMRARATVVVDPKEPPNDVWVKFGTVDYTKAFFQKSLTGFIEDAVGQVGGNLSRALLDSRLPAGPVTVTLSGRSKGFELDRFELVPIAGTPVVAAPTSSNGDLIALHYDSMPDNDDLMAMAAAREVLDAYPDRDFLSVYGAIGYRYDRYIPETPAVVAATFPDAIDAVKDGAAVSKVATSWALTLASGNRVMVAEGGPSDFTAKVLAELQRRGVSNLKGVVVVQHSTWNEDQTRPTALASVKRFATYVKIADGNVVNSTPDYFLRASEGSAPAEFRRRALASARGGMWRVALNGFDARVARRGDVDFSDTVELLYILGVPTSEVPNILSFSNRYF